MDRATTQLCAEVARAFGATRLILFGSALESPDTATDVDVACEGISGWDLYRFGAKLSEVLGKSVDVVPVTPDDRFSQYVAQRGQVLYESK